MRKDKNNNRSPFSDRSAIPAMRTKNRRIYPQFHPMETNTEPLRGKEVAYMTTQKKGPSKTPKKPGTSTPCKGC